MTATLLVQLGTIRIFDSLCRGRMMYKTQLLNSPITQAQTRLMQKKEGKMHDPPPVILDVQSFHHPDLVVDRC